MSRNFRVNQDALKQMLSFGIDRNMALQALQMTNNDVNAAVDIIVRSMRNFKPPPPPQAPKSRKTGLPICIQCKDERKDSSVVKLVSFGCDHPFCEQCLTQYYDEVIVQKERSYICIKCPWPRCNQFSQFDLTKNHLTDNAMQIVKVKQKMLPNFLPDKPSFDFRFKLSDFGYEFNKNQQLRTIETGEPYYYVNEKQYNAMGEAIIKHIQDEMKKRGLKEYFLDQQKVCNIFRTELGREKLLILIQGSGAVRAGQWARALCFNDNLHTGACLDYIDQALNEGYDVIVLNPNLNDRRRVPEDPKVKYDWTDPVKPKSPSGKLIVDIENSESPTKHCITVYDNFIMNEKHKHLFIVAHSAGGSQTVRLLRYRKKIMQKLVCIGFTDSVHGIKRDEDTQVREFIVNNAVNWAKSKKKLDSLLERKGWRNCLELSAGHPKHINTSSSCQKSLFKYLNEMYKKKCG